FDDGVSVPPQPDTCTVVCAAAGIASAATSRTTSRILTGTRCFNTPATSFMSAVACNTTVAIGCIPIVQFLRRHLWTVLSVFQVRECNGTYCKYVSKFLRSIAASRFAPAGGRVGLANK